MSASHSHLRRSSRTSASHSFGSPLTFSSANPGTRARAAAATRSIQLEGIENPHVETPSIAAASSARPRKRRHYGAEHPEGPDNASRASKSSSPPAKKRRLNRKCPPSKLKAPPPSATVSKDEEQNDKKPAAKQEGVENCCICMCDVDADDQAKINGCEHSFCFGCIEKWSERENTCPLCKCRFTKIDRINKKRNKGAKNTKKVKQRDQRSDLLPGVAIEGLLASLSATRGGASSAGLARIIFGTSGPFASTAGGAASQALGLMDSDEEGSPFALFRSLHAGRLSSGTGSARLRFSAFSSTGTSAPSASISIRYASARMSAAPLPPHARSHATNRDDPTAGNTMSNPLEIESDSDDEVEIVEVN